MPYNILLIETNMTKTFNLDREFIKWFYEEHYPDRGSNRAKVFSANEHKNVDERDYWMRCAFKQGAKIMAVETTAILGDWATACSGLDPELVCPDEVYDRAQLNLVHYYEQLELFK
jgi:hypothetical protein